MTLNVIYQNIAVDRFHLVFGVLKMVAGSIHCEMQATEGYLTCLSVGGKYCSNFLFAVLAAEVLDSAWTLYSLTETCYQVKIQVTF